MSDNTDFEKESEVLDGVAVIGMSGRFPGAESIEEFWENLKAGKESITCFSDEELLSNGIPSEKVSDPNYVKKRGLIKDPEMFDAAFFGISPREAELMDPQQRIFLESCWHTLEAAGYAPSKYEGPIGIWGGMSTGMSNNTYLLSNLHSHPDLLAEEDVLPAMLGNENDYLTTRVSYKLNLTGPSINVQTACSTSLVAITNAYQSLMTYGCDMALAGGVSVSFPQQDGYLYQEGDIGSPDGHCRPFDADAQGTVFSNGVGIVLLKRLEDALEDGDTIYAVVRGAALNNDGADKVSFAAPSVNGQAEVIAFAQAISRVEPESITYVECHGTGTPIGDPIEVGGLTKAFSLGKEYKNHCALGSVKSNFGHLDSAAGVASFIKTVLCLHNKTLVPSLHFNSQNPNIDFSDGPFYVCTDTKAWSTDQLPRRAGVSGFGIGGTNAHLVLEEAPSQKRKPAVDIESDELIVLSAKTQEALKQQAVNLAEYLSGHEDIELADIAYTLKVGREEFRHRLCLTGSSHAELSSALAGLDKQKITMQKALASSGSLVFMFPGGGAQYLQMGRDLYAAELIFRQSVDRGLELFKKRSGIDLKSVWFVDDINSEKAIKEFHRPSLQLPAIFILEMALVELWESMGIKPSAMIGHSLGENTAACVAGVISYEDALGLVSLRGKLFETVEPGGMLSIALSKEELSFYLSDEYDLATINSANQCTVSGTIGGLEKLKKKLIENEVEVQQIPIAIAAHSRLLNPILDEFREYLRSIKLNKPEIPFVSNYTGEWIGDDQATDPDYWVNHLRNTVQFSDGIALLLEEDNRVFLEVGPGKILGSLVKLQSPKVGMRVIPSLRHSAETITDTAFFTNALGRLWTSGISVDWVSLDGGRELTRVALPVYPFQRKRFLVEPVLGEWGKIDRAIAAESEEQGGDEKVVEEAISYDSRREMIEARLVKIIHEMSGIETEDIEPNESFLDMGFDSLFLTQANLRFKKEFKIKITFRQLFDDAPSIDALAAYIDAELPEDAVIGDSSASSPNQSGTQGVGTKLSTVSSSATGRFGPFKPVQRNLSGDLSEQQNEYLQKFIVEYENRTRRSKEFTAENRPHFADPRVVSGFKTLWKEITYPIVGERAKGARIWDVDGNEYVDCAGGFGAIFFGHSPDFIIDAVKQQMTTTIDYSSQSMLAGPTAKMICEFTGMDRATFCNTGSEAVLAAMRIARTVTGNDLIVTFTGDYHGIFDEVLVKAKTIDGQRCNQPIAPGIPASASQNILILEYGDPASLKIIEERAEELAAVLIEPIQSRTPELQPMEFIKEVRKITLAAEIPMIFDEIITGFRLHPKGAQGWYDVDVDIACYGKVIGGGMPIGVVAGKSLYMDALDGGMWQYGDDSFPEAGVTYFAGTFVRHPLAIAGVHAVLSKLREEGPSLQRDLNRRCAVFCEEVNRHFHSMGIPVELTYFGSVLLPRFYGNPDYEGLFFHHLRNNGIHIWEGRPIFLTTAHCEEELQILIDAFVLSAEQMCDAGFFPEADKDAEQENYPWTAPQSELWLALQMGDEARAAYNEQVIFEIDTAIDLMVLELTFDKVVNRHSSLRSVVSSDETGISVKGYMKPVFDVIDLTASSTEVTENHINTLLCEHIDAPFDYQRGPLVRLRLIQISESRSLLCLCASHLICDGWSLEVVMQDLANYYTAMIQGRQINRGTPPGLHEFLAIENEKIESGELEESKQFWLKKYSDIPDYLELPLDHSRPSLKSYNGSRHTEVIDTEIADQLRALAKQKNCTLFVVLLTCFNILLEKLSGQKDLVVGIPVAGHPNIGMPDLVAHNVSYLPLRTKINVEDSFAQLLHEVRNQFADAKGHQDFSYGSLLQSIKLPRDPGKMPLAPVSFNMDLAMAPLWFEKNKARYITTPRSHVKYDLFFNLVDEGDGISMEIDHNSDLISSASINAWGQYYTQLLREVIRDPDNRISNLTVLDNKFIDRIVKDWNDTEASLSSSNTVPELFFASVAKSPDAIAVRSNGQQLTYSELDQRSSQLANYLVSSGVQPNDFVAISLNRSVELLVGLLGILKAGATYVPLDPDYPNDRLLYMLEQSGVSVLVTESSLRNSLPEYECTRINIDKDWEAIAGNAPQQLTAPSGHSLMYVIFTSGSTGLPKGVQVPHSTVVNFLTTMAQRPGLAANDKLLAVTTLSFDIAVLELFLPLIVGATVVIADSEEASDGRKLVQLLQENAVTVMQATPSTWRLMIAAGWQGGPQFKALCGGEALPGDLAAELLSRVGEVWNMYGPTETTVWSTCSRLEAGAPVTIGTPIANTQCYVLSESMQLQPVGVAGELYIGGKGVTAGYLGREDLTAERFVDDIFRPDVKDAKLYRTGDLVRWRPDGNLEYLNRIDNQVKVRGFRIELEEIEKILLKHDNVMGCVVTVADYSEIDKRLVGYVKFKDGLAMTNSDVRRYLRKYLPDYMVVQHLIELDDIPLTPNGKVDRKALPDPFHNFTQEEHFIEATTEAEKTLAEIWAKAIGIVKVSADSYFFEIGGHSLLALEVIHQIEQDFGVRLNLQDILMDSLEQIALKLSSINSDNPEDEVDENNNSEVSSPKVGVLRRLFSQK